MDFLRKQKPGGRGYIYDKAFTWRFFLDVEKLRNFLNVVKEKATVDVHGYVFTRLEVYLFIKVYLKMGLHISVGFCVARSDYMGKAKVSLRGMSNKYRLPRFFVLFRKPDI